VLCLISRYRILDDTEGFQRLMAEDVEWRDLTEWAEWDMSTMTPTGAYRMSLYLVSEGADHD
jgi:hypothetical protein